MAKGAELVRERVATGCNTLGFGEMGIGNTSAAALLMHKYLELPLEQCVGAGTGLKGEALERKLDLLERASKLHGGKDARAILQQFGGLEIAMMTGAILEAHRLRVLVLVDGFIATSALLAAWKMKADVLEACVFSHCSDESGHRRMLDALGVTPVLNLHMRLGEGSGAAVAFPVIRAAVAFLDEMSSFDAAGVSSND